MHIPPRIFPGDEELGKRDDDHKPGSKRPLTAVWTHSRVPIRRNIKRIFIAMLAVLALYQFFKNMPIGLERPGTRPSYNHPPPSAPKVVPSPKTSPEPHSDKAGIPSAPTLSTGTGTSGEESKHWFNGPIKFYELAASLHAISATQGSNWTNRNVLFAASSLKSSATLLPLACEMAGYKRNYVHFALLGRDDIPMATLKAVNGVTKECEIWFHDARPDFSVESTEFRMEVSSSAAFGHIFNFMHPQAVIIDNSGDEDEFFIRAMRERSNALDRTLIELPANAERNLLWLTRLDSASLWAWNKFSIEILIHAQSAASGSLMRLLGSLWSADYFTATPPRLTIELPHVVDEPTRHFLAEAFRWPPSSRQVDPSTNQLSLRHRIPQTALTAEENAVRFMESFWPANPSASHVLVLSPQVELSPLYFHYLKYAILEYKYSLNSQNGAQNLMGISLDLPSTYLNDTAAFVPPSLKAAEQLNPSFLWQAPNSNAALYFGDKWVEIHSFISDSLASQRGVASDTGQQPKLVSKTYPSWLEYILRLARTRGYFTMYPVLDNSDALATLHNELYRPPEEFMRKFGGREHIHNTSLDEDNHDFTADPQTHLSLQHTEMQLALTSLLNLFPPNTPLPAIPHMPLLTWDGQRLSPGELQQEAMEYSLLFSRQTGGCSANAAERPRIDGSAADLFCLDDSSRDDVPS